MATKEVKTTNVPQAIGPYSRFQFLLLAVESKYAHRIATSSEFAADAQYV